jgi:hypothetical protein
MTTEAAGFLRRMPHCSRAVQIEAERRTADPERTKQQAGGASWAHENWTEATGNAGLERVETTEHQTSTLEGKLPRTANNSTRSKRSDPKKTKEGVQIRSK